jgi:hypothetical protein
MANFRLLAVAVALIGLAPLAAAGAPTDTTSLETQYTRCSFRPQDAACQPVHQAALTDASPAAASVRDAFIDYGRYLAMPAASLTDGDRRYLKANNIALPANLDASNLSGLHHVIADQTLSSDARRMAVVNYLSRAVEAELYCAFNACGKRSGGAMG